MDCGILRIIKDSDCNGGKNVNEGTTQVYYGEGHGKSAAAIGTAIRFASQGKEVVMIQFLKGKDENEENFMQRLESEIKSFRFAKCMECFDELSEEKRQEEIMNLRNGFQYGKKVITTGACQLVILDEILGVIDEGVITEEEFLEMISNKPEDLTVICTGRVLKPGIKQAFDVIYNIQEEKSLTVE